MKNFNMLFVIMAFAGIASSFGQTCPREDQDGGALSFVSYESFSYFKGDQRELLRYVCVYGGNVSSDTTYVPRKPPVDGVNGWKMDNGRWRCTPGEYACEFDGEPSN
jgi:hypothetical protein